MKIPNTPWYTTAMRSPNGGLWYGYALNVSDKSPTEIKEMLAFFHKQGVIGMHEHSVEHGLGHQKSGDRVIQVVGGRQSVSVRAFEKILQENMNATFPKNRFDSLLDIQKPTHWIPTTWNGKNGLIKGFRLSVREVSDQKKKEITDFLNNAAIRFKEKTVSRATDTLIGGEVVIAVMDQDSLQHLQRFWDITKWGRQKSNTDIDYDIANEETVYAQANPGVITSRNSKTGGR